MARKPKLGTGQRFRQLVGQLKRKGVENPAALAAWIGRKKYGKQRFQQLATAGRKRRMVSASKRRGVRKVAAVVARVVRWARKMRRRWHNR